MEPWGVVLLASGVAGAIAYGVSPRLRAAFDEDEDSALIRRVGTELLRDGTVSGGAEEALLVRARKIEEEEDEEEGDVFLHVLMGAFSGLLAAGVAAWLIGGLWVLGWWEGRHWPLVERPPPSLSEVEDDAARRLERTVTCGRTDADERFVCGDGAGRGWIVRLENGDRVAIERNARPAR